MRVTFKRFRCF